MALSINIYYQLTIKINKIYNIIIKKIELRIRKVYNKQLNKMKKSSDFKLRWRKITTLYYYLKFYINYS